jgi:hypothetical protein
LGTHGRAKLLVSWLLGNRKKQEEGGTRNKNAPFKVRPLRPTSPTIFQPLKFPPVSNESIMD